MSIAHPRDPATRLLLSALLIVPFLIPIHYLPIASFWAEWWAAVLGLALATVVLSTRDAVPLRLPHATIALLVLAASALLQFALGRIHVAELGQLRLAYLAWAGLLALTGWQLARRHGLDWVAAVAATALLAGAFFNALLVLLQAGSVELPTQLMFRHPQQLLGGNLAQPNHLNHHLWLGLVSLVYLYMTRRCKTPFAFCALVVLVAASTLTASRSTLLYAPAIIALAWIGGPPSNQDDWRGPLRRATTCVGVLVVLFLFAHHLAVERGYLPRIASPTGIERFFQDGGGMASRLAIWRRAWQVFLDFPWLGAGVGELPWQNYLTVAQLPLRGDMVVVEHSHNLPLHLLAESGLVATLLCAALLWRWWRNLSFLPASAARWWICAALSIAAIHSLLEYPLWYAFFLGPAALLLGACDQGIALPRLPLPRLAIAGTAAIVGGLLLLKLCSDFIVLEKRINPWLAPPVVELRASLFAPDLTALRGHSLFSPWIDFAIVSQMEIAPEGIEDKMRTCARTMHFYPQASIAFKCAMIDALGGRKEQAQAEMARAIDAYPGSVQEQMESLVSLAARYPALESLRK